MPPPLVTTTHTAQDGKRSPRLSEFRAIAEVDNEEEEEVVEEEEEGRKTLLGRGRALLLSFEDRHSDSIEPQRIETPTTLAMGTTLWVRFVALASAVMSRMTGRNSSSHYLSCFIETWFAG